MELPPDLREASALLDRASALIGAALGNPPGDDPFVGCYLADACASAQNARRHLYFLETSLRGRARVLAETAGAAG